MKKVLIILVTLILVGVVCSIYSNYQRNEQAKIDLMKKQVEAQQKAANEAAKANVKPMPKLDLGQDKPQTVIIEEQPKHCEYQPWTGRTICY